MSESTNTEPVTGDQLSQGDGVPIVPARVNAEQNNPNMLNNGNNNNDDGDGVRGAGSVSVPDQPGVRVAVDSEVSFTPPFTVEELLQSRFLGVATRPGGSVPQPGGNIAGNIDGSHNNDPRAEAVANVNAQQKSERTASQEMYEMKEMMRAMMKTVSELSGQMLEVKGENRQLRLQITSVMSGNNNNNYTSLRGAPQAVDTNAGNQPTVLNTAPRMSQRVEQDPPLSRSTSAEQAQLRAGNTSTTARQSTTGAQIPVELAQNTSVRPKSLVNEDADLLRYDMRIIHQQSIKELPKFSSEPTEVVKWEKQVRNMIVSLGVTGEAATQMVAFSGGLLQSVRAWMDKINWRTLTYDQLLDKVLEEYVGQEVIRRHKRGLRSLERAPNQTITQWCDHVRDQFQLYEPEATEAELIGQFMDGFKGQIAAELKGISYPKTLKEAVESAKMVEDKLIAYNKLENKVGINLVEPKNSEQTTSSTNGSELQEIRDMLSSLSNTVNVVAKRETNKKSELTCFRCRQKGHKAKECKVAAKPAGYTGPWCDLHNTSRHTNETCLAAHPATGSARPNAAAATQVASSSGSNSHA